MNLFTIDIDWAAEEVIEDTLQLFEQYNVKCTVFATHQSSVVKSCNREIFEIGIHPNFNPLLFEKKQQTTDEVIDNILDLYPEAKGIRSHSLTQNSFFFEKFITKGLVYEANLFLPYWNNIKPFKMWNGLEEFRITGKMTFISCIKLHIPEAGLDINSNSLNVFDFHPIHIYLNTEEETRYVEAKKNYHNVAALKELKNTTTAGTRDLLIKLLENQRSCNEHSNKLLELAHTV